MRSRRFPKVRRRRMFRQRAATSPSMVVAVVPASCHDIWTLRRAKCRYGIGVPGENGQDLATNLLTNRHAAGASKKK